MPFLDRFVISAGACHALPTKAKNVEEGFSPSYGGQAFHVGFS
jgi:hypothetical protein